MQQRINTPLDKPAVISELRSELELLGRGEMDSVPYDTAWLSRLQSTLPTAGFEGSMAWLRSHQLEDGSWGGKFVHYHDRFICTLAAVLALYVGGTGQNDQRQLRRGLNALWRYHGKLHRDVHDTIGFPVLSVALVEEAAQFDLDIPTDVLCDWQVVRHKLDMLHQASHKWRNNSLCFSLEGVLRRGVPDEIDFVESNGSIGTSPAATAALMIYSNTLHDGGLHYLHTMLEPDGGIGNMGPLDTVEIAWALDHLRHTGAISPDDPAIQKNLAVLWRAWSPERGLPASSVFSVHDLDCSSCGFSVLQWAGYPVETDAFARYELEDHFLCFQGEANPSLSAHVRLLGALRMANDERAVRWMPKVLGFLRNEYANGRLWFDKWHISPYYLRSAAVIAMQGLADDVAAPLVSWMLRTQNPDGGWGFSGESTLEETAYCMLALQSWQRMGRPVDSEVLAASATWLGEHWYTDDSYPPLWIGKCLYTPRRLVRLAVLSALYGSLEQGDLHL